MKNFDYVAPRTIEEAVRILDDQRGSARILAGGTDLILKMKDGRLQPSVLVDVKKIPELNRLEWEDGKTLHIGAAVPLNKIAAFAPVAKHFAVLAQSCSLIGSHQVRNRATAGGNLCNAAPSADSAPGFLCVGAGLVAAGLKSTRTIPIENFFIGPGETVLEEGELLVEITVPALPESAGCYVRHTPRNEMDIAVGGVAGLLVFDAARTCTQARIALGAVAPTPVRAVEAEKFLFGKLLTDEVIAEAAQLAVQSARPISDVRGSAQYRMHLVDVLTRRALQGARDAHMNCKPERG